MHLSEVGRWGEDELAHFLEKIQPLMPVETLVDHIKMFVPDCNHPETVICQKSASDGSLMYFKVCSTCGRSMTCGKGELSHRNVALRHRVEDIAPKEVFDTAGEKHMSQVRQKRMEFFDAYREYLSSQQWEAIRQKVINRDGSCRACGDSIDCVHHITYERLFNEDLEDLAGLCQGCHEVIHEIRP